MRILVNGALGRMGKEVIATLEKNGVEYIGVDLHAQPGSGLYASLAECSEPVDAIVDFSSHLATKDLTAYAAAHKLPSSSPPPARRKRKWTSSAPVQSRCPSSKAAICAWVSLF